MNRCLSIITSLLLITHLSAQNDANNQLINIFNEAEQCYLLDDYQQLKACLNKYYNAFIESQQSLGDSVDVYMAYYYKMCGTYYYGFAENELNASSSELCYRKALDIFKKRNNVTNVMTLHEELAQLYYKANAYDKAILQLDSIFTYYDECLNDMGIESVKPNFYNTLTQLAICNARLGNYDIAIKQIEESINNYYKKHKNNEYYEALRKRGKILMLQADNLGSTFYKKAVDSYQKYVNERYVAIEKETSSMNDSQRNQYWLATHHFLYDCCRLGNHAPGMLYDLALFSKDFLVRKNTKRARWQQIKQVLDKNECAIEFVQYFGKKDEKRMGCLVLKHNSPHPIFIDMFSTDSLLNVPISFNYTIGNAISNSESLVKDILYNYPQLPELIWTRPLMSAIDDAQKIYFAPDGMLNLLAMEYLMPDTTKTCYRLSSTRVLIQPKSTPNMKSALLCGGVEYGASFQPNDKDNDVIAYRFLAPQTTTINYLPASKEEVDSISTIRNNPNDLLLVGAKATDENFLHLLKNHYSIIHLSTHGYYGGRIGIYNDIKPLLDDESMSKSGLLFAGAANTLTDENFDENMFDGVLSAAELSKQDLSKTELIVLSACQTGLGQLTDDGIYGIQRGLKLAGAKAMILSLWSVNDYSGSMLMRFFYDELEKSTSKNIHSAFLKARQRLSQEELFYFNFDESTLCLKRECIRFNAPRYVNPFIIIDAY